MKRLVAIGLVWFGCAFAWMILGATLVARSGEASSALTQEVHRLWGPPMNQRPPRAIAPRTGSNPSNKTAQPPSAQDERRTDESAAASASTDAAQSAVEIGLVASDIEIELDLEQRQKGLLWFPTYTVDFRARYTFQNASTETREATITFPLEHGRVVYDGFEIADQQAGAIEASVQGGAARWTDTFAPGEARTYVVKYRSRGTSRFGYELTAGTGQVKDFRLAMKTDFDEVNFPPGTLSPSRHERLAGGGWSGEWAFSSLIADAPIGLELPQKTNPGPLASRITFFAPVGLLFYFFVVAILATYQRRRVHPLNYFFFGCGFFAFHLLFAYLLDHLPIAPSFAISSAVSILLVVTYARLFTGWRFALLEMGLSQLVYLVLFSLTFLWTGFTGLAVTVGAILSLFVMMQLTGRADWRRIVDAPAPPSRPGAEPPIVPGPGPAEVEPRSAPAG